MLSQLRLASPKFLLALVAVLLAANLVVQLGLYPRCAQAAGIPDSGAQMQAVIDELKDVNKRLDGMQHYLESGNLVVKARIDKDVK